MWGRLRLYRGRDFPYGIQSGKKTGWRMGQALRPNRKRVIFVRVLNAADEAALAIRRSVRLRRNASEAIFRSGFFACTLKRAWRARRQHAVSMAAREAVWLRLVTQQGMRRPELRARRVTQSSRPSL